MTDLFLKKQSAFWQFQTITVSNCCLIKLLPYILFEKCIYILAKLEKVSPGDHHCANCIGTLSFTVDVTGNADQLLAAVVDSTLKTARARMMLARDSLVDIGRTPRLLPQKLQ